MLSNSFRSILAATDLSEPATVALEWAVEIAADHRAELHVLHALNLTGWSTDYLEVDAQVPAQIHQSAQERLEETVSSLAREQLCISCETKVGEPCETVLATARSRDSDLIVVGTRGQRGLDYLLLGSTAQRVVQRAHCPVLTVHPKDAQKERPIRKIIVATDFSHESELALQASLALAERGSPTEIEILVLHAYLVPYELMTTEGHVSTAAGLAQWQTAQADVDQRLEALAASLQPSGIKLRSLGLEGYPPEVIVERARDHGVDLIAMGTHGRTGLSHVLLGSTAERVIHQAPCPVLTVRRQ